ncbi:MAG: nucleotidyltransferase domain-containing protein [Candidatus Omnitrophica bacterium]|nr:nucleotidyltransferase domain-containing protein [Candidatus Omnitrophota bacterium]MBU2437511.1 nucleotidyltransferase domain-containing protein [Candidatus Omnitrophota bacterium]
MNTQLDKRLSQQIVELIVNYKKPEKIVIFGSRAGDNFKETSDIDIAIFGRNWTDTDINIVKFNLDEYIKTPLKFDLLNFCNISKASLRENILNKGRVIYDSGKD